MFTALALGLTLSLSAQEDSYTAKLKKMFEVSGTEQSYQQAIDMTLNMSKDQYPDLGDEFWNEMSAEFKGTSIDELTEMLVPVYKKYLSEDELDEIIAFYNTPAGKKLASSNPQIMQESMSIGQAWGAKLGEKVMRKVMDQKN